MSISHWSFFSCLTYYSYENRLSSCLYLVQAWQNPHEVSSILEGSFPWFNVITNNSHLKSKKKLPSKNNLEIDSCYWNFHLRMFLYLAETDLNMEKQLLRKLQRKGLYLQNWFIGSPKTGNSRISISMKAGENGQVEFLFSKLYQQGILLFYRG